MSRTSGPTSTSTRVSSTPTEAYSLARRVLGIDPGSRSTGWGVVEGTHRSARFQGCGSIHPPRSATRAIALASLSGSIRALLAEFQPVVAVVETPFAGRFPAAALALAEARGAILVALGEWGGEVVEIEPARMKAAIVGSGRAEKRQVAYVISRQLGLVEEPGPDAADALALALCYLRSGLP